MQEFFIEILVGAVLIGMGVWLRSMAAASREMRRDHELFFQRVVRLEASREESVRRLANIEDKLDMLIKFYEHLSAWLEVQQKRHGG